MKRGCRKQCLLCLCLAIIIASCMGCTKEQSNEPSPQTPYELWKSFNLHNYSIDQVRLCYCVHAGELVRITIHADTIFQIRRTSDSSIVQYPYYRSIDSLFALIRNLKNDSLVIRYNSQYGYPEYLDVDPQLHPIDAGYLIETSNLQIL